MGENTLDLANFLQNSMRNNTAANDGFGLGGNNGMLWIFLLLLFGYGGGGGVFGGRNAAGAVINDAAITGAVETAIAKAQSAGVSDQLMLQAVSGNKEAIDKLAITYNADSNRVQSALCAINSAIDKVAGEVGMTSQQVINAIQAGNASIMSQMQACCCDLKTAISNASYENRLEVLNQTNALGEALRTQTSVLGAKIDAQTQIINDKFCALEIREQARIIDAQQSAISDLKNKLSTQEVLAAIAAKSTTTTTGA